MSMASSGKGSRKGGFERSPNGREGIWGCLAPGGAAFATGGPQLWVTGWDGQLLRAATGAGPPEAQGIPRGAPACALHPQMIFTGEGKRVS